MAVTYVHFEDPTYGPNTVPMDPVYAALTKREIERPGFTGNGSMKIVETRVSYGPNPITVTFEEAVANAAYWAISRGEKNSDAEQAAIYLKVKPAPFPASLYQQAATLTREGSGLQGLFGGRP